MTSDDVLIRGLKPRMRAVRRLWIAGFLALGGLAGPAQLSALQVTPTVQLFTLPRGGEEKAQVTLTNTEDTDLTVKALAADWHEYPANKSIKTADWLKVSGEPFVLKKGESKVIPFKIDLPKKAVGEVMGMLSFDTKSPTTGDLTFRMSVAIYAAIQGTEKIDASVEAIMVNPSSDTAFGYLLVNKGNIHLRPYGLMEVFDENDALIANVVFTKEAPTHPGQAKGYYHTLKAFRLPDGRYKAVIGLSDADREYQLPVFKKKFSMKEGKVELK